MHIVRHDAPPVAGALLSTRYLDSSVTVGIASLQPSVPSAAIGLAGMKNACVVDDETLSRVEPETHFHRRIIDDFAEPR